MKEKVLLDTDIGMDVDDAVCLAYLLAHPQCDLLGITTVTGEAEKRAMLASVLCRVAGRDIPIFPGAEDPLLVPQKQKSAPQAAALRRWPHQRRFPEGAAIEFLRTTIRAHPGEITLLAIGPLTNIGLLFAVDPDIPALLKGLVMMGGYFFHRLEGVDPVEWNASGDPHASTIVYRSRVALHRSVGLDVTRNVVLSADQVRQQFRGALLEPVLDYAEIWFKDYYPSITFHDPLAAATLFEPDLCRYRMGTVAIELADAATIGLTHWQEGSIRSPHQVATNVDREAYFRHFYSLSY
ncbi:MAG TPA: nucleoside hydrolase [bacterium]|nr:nucleoside hydrolase [bacterium]HPR88899.1 nucleoside hydrolase [bacterium]